ncbi:MAG: iron donor protein CyaY [Sideroxydans sp.]|nr:iron donor protein CyaY [Sideroxydans sp.]
MTENEFNTLADTAFQRIEHALDASDIDYDSNGMVMEIEFDDGSKVIVNRHVPNREIWLAARSGGFHFGWQNDAWISQREGDELYTKLTALIQSGSGSDIRF